MDEAEAADRIDTLVDRATSDREAFEQPDSPPAPDRAMAFLREGVGPAVWTYVEARTNGLVVIPPDDFARLEGAMNDWLELYTRCYGTDIEADFTIREAAELLIETRNIQDVAQLLTHVPRRPA
jgi:hypothetical protein